MMIAGIVRMVLSAPAMLGGEDRPARLDGRERSGRRPRPQAFIAPPSEMAPGLCWLCGGAVKSGSQICLHCGAAQAPAPPGESTTSRLSGFDPDASHLSSYIPSASEPARPTPRREPERPTPRREPARPTPRREPARPTPQRELQQDSNRGQRPPPKAVWRPAADADEGWEQPYDDEADWDAPPARRPRRGRR